MIAIAGAFSHQNKNLIMYRLNEADIYLAVFAGVFFLLTAIFARFTANGSVLALRLFLIIFFVQYFSTILIVSSVGYWSAFVMVPQAVSGALRYALFCAFCVICGYFISSAVERSSSARVDPVSQNKSRRSSPGLLSRFGAAKGNDWRSSYWIISVVTALLILESIVREGQISAVFVSQLPRGFGQFEGRSLIEKSTSVLFSLNSILGLVAALFLGRALGCARSLNMVAVTPVVLFLIFICAAPLMHSFSRASGAAFIIAAIGISLSSGRSLIKPFLILVFVSLGLYFCVVGITQRSFAPMGVLSFIQSAVNLDPAGFEWLMTVSSTGSWVLGPRVNFFDALGPLSASMYFSGSFDGGAIQGLAWLVAILQPLPSFMVPIDYRPGASLSSALGTWGSTGITRPAVAELHFLMGFWGFAPLMAYGAFLRTIDRLLIREGFLPLVIFLLIIAGIVIGGHSGIRAFARPTVLALIVVLLSGKVYSFGPLTLDLRFRAS
jgi:hypothetical protein